MVYQAEDFGTVIDSHRLVSVPYDLSFRVDRENELVCSKELTPQEVKQFRRAAADDYYFQMFYDDDLPLWGFIGKVCSVLLCSLLNSHYRQYHVKPDSHHLVRDTRKCAVVNGPRLTCCRREGWLRN